MKTKFESVTLRRLNSGRFVVLVENNVLPFKTRAHRLSEALGAKWSRRYKGYLMADDSIAQMFVDLYHEGYDADMDGTMHEPGSPFVIERRAELDTVH